MEINALQKLEKLRKLIAPYFNTLKDNNDKSDDYKAQIMAVNYYELGCVISNLLKMCIFSLDNEAHIRSSTNKNPINVSLILEMVLEMFPIDELELLGEINQILNIDSLSVIK
ncbi:MAG: hypothetical protein ABI892_13610 [Flavobacterium sp.]